MGVGAVSVERTTVRRARKARPCTGYVCERTIQPGDLYNEHVAGPGHPDLDNEHWIRLAECAACAADVGRPIPGAKTISDETETR